MGLFSGLKSTYKKSEAAVVVQNLLEHQGKVGMFTGDPGKTATAMVASVWRAKPAVFDGSFGQRPHKLSVAAAALANAITALTQDSPHRAGIGIALGNLLSHLEVNGSLYPFNGIDQKLVETSLAVFLELSGEFE